MANSLSHALHPPLVQPPVFTSYDPSQPPPAAVDSQRQEEEEDDDDEIVEDELNNHTPRSPSAAQTKSGGATTTADSKNNYPPASQPDADGKVKRGPGRPRGSRTSKKTTAKTTSNSHNFFQYPPPPGGSQNSAIHPHHQQYYEFQWRALNLCSEFYNAAEELVKGTSPLVIAQCYSMGPGAKLDPLGMITDAKRICDGLLANPSQLVNNPPPTVYPSYNNQPGYGAAAHPNQYPSQPYSTPIYPHPSSYSPHNNTNPTNDNGSTNVISNAQSFVMPLGPPAMAPGPSYTMYPSRYPSTPYYQYPPGSTSYYASAAQNSAPASTSTPNATASPSWPTGYNQGAWSEEEVERLKQLTEQSKEHNTGPHKGEIDWDWVISTWGNTRTRHQILLKATALGLKESTTRGVKRRRGETEPDPTGTTSQPSTDNPSTSTALPAAASESPAQSSSESRPASPSPVMSTLHPPVPQTQPTPTSRPSPTTATTVQWALPTTVPNPPQTERAYYRQRPYSSSKPDVQHQFRYASGSAGSV